MKLVVRCFSTVYGVGDGIHWFTSQQRDEGDEPVLLDHLAEFEVKVVLGVGLQRVLEQDASTHQQVVEPVGDVEHDSA